MISLPTTLLWILATVCLVVGTDNSGSASAVVDLEPKNFDNITLSGKPVLVEFFAPWCGHCKALAPVWEQLAKDFVHARDQITIAKVDADAKKSLGKRFDIQGFPTIKFFDGINEKPQDYDGKRDLESLSEFITQKTGVRAKKPKNSSSNVLILNDNTFKSQINGNKDVIVAFTATWCGHCKNLAPIWEKVAQDFAQEPDIIIAKVDAEGETSKATAKEQGVSSYPTIKFFAKGSKESESYSGGRTEADFVNYLNKKTGAHRTPGGGLDAAAGTIEELDALISKLTESSNIAKVSAEITNIIKGLDNKTKHQYASYYVRVIEKLATAGDFATKELARLSKILQKGGLTLEKNDEFTVKVNILRRFPEFSSSKDEL